MSESKKNALQKTSFANDHLNSLEELIGRLRRLNENVGFAYLSEVNWRKVSLETQDVCNLSFKILNIGCPSNFQFCKLVP